MPPDSAKLLRDMLDAAQTITMYCRDVPRERFLAQRPLRDAVHWNLMIIGEAMSQLRKGMPQVAQQISESDRIVAFRNQLIHGYGVIQAEITWSIVTDKLPILLSELGEILDGLPEP